MTRYVLRSLIYGYAGGAAGRVGGMNEVSMYKVVKLRNKGYFAFAWFAILLNGAGVIWNAVHDNFGFMLVSLACLALCSFFFGRGTA